MIVEESSKQDASDANSEQDAKKRDSKQGATERSKVQVQEEGSIIKLEKGAESGLKKRRATCNMKEEGTSNKERLRRATRKM